MCSLRATVRIGIRFFFTRAIYALSREAVTNPMRLRRPMGHQGSNGWALHLSHEEPVKWYVNNSRFLFIGKGQFIGFGLRALRETLVFRTWRTALRILATSAASILTKTLWMAAQRVVAMWII